MAADLEADAGSDAALPLIEQLRGYQPAEADIILATLRLRQSRFEESTAALEAAYVRLRDDPWPIAVYKRRALSLATLVTDRHPAAAARLFEALRQPFAVQALTDLRLLTMTELSQRSDFAGTCRVPIGALEPHVPWTGTFLIARRDCYQATSDPRLATATREVLDYFVREPLPLAPR
jgi:hypothetical protein